MKWQASSSEVCFAACEFSCQQYTQDWGLGDLGSVASDIKQGPSVTADAPISFLFIHTVGHWNLSYHSSQGNQYLPLPPSHCKQPKTHMFMMLCSELARKWIHMTGAGYETYLRQQWERPQVNELEHVQNRAGNYQPLPSRSDRLFDWFESSPPEADPVLKLKMLSLPCRVLWHFDRGLFYMLGVADSSKIWVTGIYCLFSRNLQSLRLFLTERIESTASFIINIMPWEKIQQQTRQTRSPVSSTVPSTK